MATLWTQDCYVAFELSRAKWLVGALLPGHSKITTTLVPGGDTAALLDVLTRLAARATCDSGGPAALKVCYEAGYDGFWLARFLIGHGIETRCEQSHHVLMVAELLTSSLSKALPKTEPLGSSVACARWGAMVRFHTISTSIIDRSR